MDEKLRISLQDDFSRNAAAALAANEALMASLNKFKAPPVKASIGTQLQGLRASLGVATSSFAGFKAVTGEALAASSETIAGWAEAGKARLSSFGDMLLKTSAVAVSALAAIGGAFTFKSVAMADQVQDLNQALEMFTGQQGMGDKVRAIAREFALSVTDTQSVFIDLASSNIKGAKAEEIFARLQDLTSMGVDKSRTDSLKEAFKKIAADDKLDPGDLKALQTGGVNKPAFYAALAKNLGQPIEDVKAMVAGGTVKGDDAIRAALDVIKANTGGGTAGAQAKDDLATTLAGGVQNLKGAFDQFQLDVGNSLFESLKPALPLISQIAATLSGADGRGFAKNVADSIGGVITFLISHFDDFKAAFFSVVDGVKAGFAPISALFATLFGGAKGDSGAVIRGIGEAIGTVLKFAIPVLAVVLPLIKVFGILGTVVEVVSGVFSVLSSVGGALLTVGEVVGGVVAAIGAVPVLIGAAVIAAGVLIWTFRDEIISALTSAWEFMAGIFQTIGNGISAAFTWYFDTIVGVFTGIWNFITTTVPQIAGSIIDGLVNGLTAGASAVVGKITEVATGALNAFKGVFGIRSPSKEMGNNAGHVISGFTNSLDTGKKHVDAAMSDTFAVPDMGGQGAVAGSSMTAGFAVPDAGAMAPSGGGGGGDTVGGPAAPGGGGGNKAVSITAPVTITVSGAGDPQAVAKATAEEVKRSLKTSMDLAFA